MALPDKKHCVLYIRNPTTKKKCSSEASLRVVAKCIRNKSGFHRYKASHREDVKQFLFRLGLTIMEELMIGFY